MRLHLQLLAVSFSVFNMISAASDAANVIGEDAKEVRRTTVTAAAADAIKTEVAAVDHQAIERQDDQNMQELSENFGKFWESVCKVGFGGFARDFRRVFNYTLSDENVSRMQGIYSTSVGKVSDVYCKVRGSVPGWALAGAAALVVDSVTLEMFFQSTPWATVAGASACYLAAHLPQLTTAVNAGVDTGRKLSALLPANK